MKILNDLSKLIFKKPVLTNSEMIIEKRKDEISGQIERCRSTHESMEILAEHSKADDALLLFKHSILDLIKLASLIYGLKGAKTLKDAENNVATIPDEKISELFAEIISMFKKCHSNPRDYAGKKIQHRSEKSLYRLLYMLEKSYEGVKKKTMMTQLDTYKKRLRYQIGIILIILITSVSVLWGTFHFRKIRAIAEIKTNMSDMAGMAHGAKKSTGKTLGQITGSECSICACRGNSNLKDLSDTDPCVKSWYSAIGNIYRIVKRKSSVPEEFLRDPWGSPYALDENEGEFGVNDCRNDQIRSAGPDGVLNTDDDIVVIIRNAFCKNR